MLTLWDQQSVTWISMWIPWNQQSSLRNNPLMLSLIKQTDEAATYLAENQKRKESDDFPMEVPALKGQASNASRTTTSRVGTWMWMISLVMAILKCFLTGYTWTVFFDRTRLKLAGIHFWSKIERNCMFMVDERTSTLTKIWLGRNQIAHSRRFGLGEIRS